MNQNEAMVTITMTRIDGVYFYNFSVNMHPQGTQIMNGTARAADMATFAADVITRILFDETLLAAGYRIGYLVVTFVPDNMLDSFDPLNTLLSIARANNLSLLWHVHNPAIHGRT